MAADPAENMPIFRQKREYFPVLSKKQERFWGEIFIFCLSFLSVYGNL